MAWKTQTKKRWYRHWLLWTLAILAVAVFFGWRKAKGRYQRWNAGRQVRHGEESIARGDFKHAMLEARSALEVNPMDPAATRIMARGLEGAGAAAMAMTWRSRLDSLVPGDPENLLAWAADSMKAGDLAATERVLGMIDPARQSAVFHGIAAQLSMARRDIPAAEKHWTEAVRMDPKNDQYRLPLAKIQLHSPDSQLRTAATSTLKELGEKKPRNVEAIRILLGEALRHEDWKQADALSASLVSDPSATFAEKLDRLAALRKMDTQDAPGYLTELRKEALTNPNDLYLLFMWMNQHDLALMVSEWARTLPPDVIGVPPTCVAVADAYVRGSEWQRLKEYLDERAWGEWDYMRRAFLARAQERLNEVEMAVQEWQDGISAARSRGDATLRLERMVRLAIGWGWEQRAQEVMWGMAGSPNCPRWMLDALWLIAIENKDTAQLQKLAGILAQADSKSAVFRNNFAFFSLLIRSEDGNPHREAERLFTENPGDASIAVTRALSLSQQGKIADAVALTGSIPAAELKKPQIALYHAIFLTAAGESAKAAEFLAVAQDRKMFPEEKTMLERARLGVAKAAGERDVAEAVKVARAARAARDLEASKAVDAARTARAAQAAQESVQSPARQ